MITAAFDLAAWTVLFFIVGMIKPKWPLFFLKNPDRFLVLIITTVFVMITFTLFGEGHKRSEAEKVSIAKMATPQASVEAVPVPTVTPDSSQSAEPVKK